MQATMDIICGFFQIIFSGPPETIRPYRSKLSATCENLRHFCFEAYFGEREHRNKLSF